MMSGGMMAGMEQMMSRMGAPPRRELYPTLMSLPEFSPEVRKAVETEGDKRFREGVFQFTSGTRELSAAIERGDAEHEEQSLRAIREGLSLMESGLATKRLLAEGKPPKEIALQWFRKEMNLPSPAAIAGHAGPLSFSVLHLVTMSLLFACTALGFYAYVSRMHRARVLLRNLAAPGVPGSGLLGAEAPAPEPIGPTRWKGTLRLAQVVDETPAIKTFRFVDAATGTVPFTFLPGQFTTLAAVVGGKRVSRAYTIASSPTEQRFLELTIKREEQGVFSRYLHDELKVGGTVEATGPQGVFTFTGSEAKRLVLIGAGVGVTPLMSVLRHLTATNWHGHVSLLFVCRHPEDYLFRTELEETARRNPNFRLVVTMTKADPAQWTGLRGRFTREMILEHLPDVREARIHICGPNQMMDDTKALLLDIGEPLDAIKLESFGTPRRDEPPTPLGRSDQGTIVSTSNTALFKPSNKTAFLPPDLTVLEAAESVGVNIENSCRAGTCGLCKVRLVSGQVAMAVQDSLTEEDKQKGIVLACQAKSAGNVVVEVPPE
jgi:ferredoxin-NADP reductase